MAPSSVLRRFQRTIQFLRNLLPSKEGFKKAAMLTAKFLLVLSFLGPGLLPLSFLIGCCPEGIERLIAAIWEFLREGTGSSPQGLRA